MAELLVIIVKGARAGIMRWEKMKDNRKDCEEIQDLINIMKDACLDVKPLYEGTRIVRGRRATEALLHLKDALEEASELADRYRKHNIFVEAWKVEEKANKIRKARRRINSMMNVSLHATVNETNRGVEELRLKFDAFVMSLCGDGRRERGRNNDTRGTLVGCQGPLVLTRNQLLERQRADTDGVSEALRILPGVAAVLLRSSNWDHERVVNGWWFQYGRKLREAVGLPLSSEDVSLLRPCKKRERHCNRCSAYGTVISAGCSHYYCKVCWRGYINEAVRTSFQECVSLQCLDPSCRMPVIQELVGMVQLEEQSKNLYAMSAFSSYVEHSGGKIKWCRGRYCVRAIEFHGDKNAVVACDLKHSFCWSCGKEPHGPLACGAPPRENRKAAVASAHFMARELGITDVAKLNFLKEAYQVMDKCRVDIKWAHSTNRRSHLDQKRFHRLLQEASDSFKILEILARVGWFNLYSDRIETEASSIDATTAFKKAYMAFKEKVVATTKETRHKVDKLVKAVKTDFRD